MLKKETFFPKLCNNSVPYSAQVSSISRENNTNNTTSHTGFCQQMLHKWSSSSAVREALRNCVQNLCYLTSLPPAARQPRGTQHPVQADSSARSSVVGKDLTLDLSVPGSQTTNFPVAIETVSRKSWNTNYLLSLSP